MVDGDQIRPESVEIGIDRAIDGPVAAEEMNQARGRHRHLGCALGEAAHECELAGGDAAGAAPQLQLDISGLERGVAAGRVVKIEQRVLGGQSFDRLDEAEEPRSAPELAVGDRLEPHLFLQGDGLADATVLNVAKRAFVD